jgi:hypothetical protein
MAFFMPPCPMIHVVSTTFEVPITGAEVYIISCLFEDEEDCKTLLVFFKCGVLKRVLPEGRAMRAE